MFSNGFKLFSLKGFDIKLDPSWILIAALITWGLSQQYFPAVFPDQSGQTYAAMALVAMLCFFASLLLHELAHSIVARRMGLPISGITLFLFGGVAELDSEPQSPRVEFWVALAGPAMSLSLALGFWLLALLTAQVGSVRPLTEILSYLAVINLILAVFNLIPAFPLDGGRVLRSILWRRHGDVLRATAAAARTGAVFAYVLMGLGVLGLFQGAVVTGLWQIMIGFFILTAARSSYQSQVARVAFANKSVSQLMKRDPVTVPPEMTLEDFVNRVMLHHSVSFVPVIADGVLLGHMDPTVLSGIDRENWSSTHIGDVFAGLDASSTIPPKMPLQELLKLISRTGRRKFMVVEGRDLVGVITLADILRYLQLSVDVMQSSRNG
jgi:Zn-dependent protease/predicted transcriptional regulator